MISVCMATYNGERFLREQIDSILCQLAPEDELIISDDGSTDGTLGIIQSYNDPRIRLLHHERKAEYAKIKYSRNFYYATDNFENALKAARGEYIFLADQDDIWMENKVEKMTSALKHSNLVMSNFNTCNERGQILIDNFYTRSPISSSTILNLINSKFIGCCMAFDKKILVKSLPFPKKLLAHDLWIGLIASRTGTCSFIEESNMYYRRTGNNVSSSTEKSQNSLFFKLYYRICIALKLAMHCFLNSQVYTHE